MPLQTADQPTVLLPLPAFRQPLRDLPLPEETGDPTSTTPGPSTDSPSGPLQPDSPDGSPLPPLAPSPEPHGRTRTYTASDYAQASRVLHGLIAIACGIAFAAFSRRGLLFRQPTRGEISDVTDPLGRVAARHLPMDLIGPDLLDLTEAAAAGHSYVLAGPIIARPDMPLPEDPS
jgi:hypothetical protein